MPRKRGNAPYGLQPLLAAFDAAPAPAAGLRLSSLQTGEGNETKNSSSKNNPIAAGDRWQGPVGKYLK